MKKAIVINSTVCSKTESSAIFKAAKINGTYKGAPVFLLDEIVPNSKKDKYKEIGDVFRAAMKSQQATKTVLKNCKNCSNREQQDAIEWAKTIKGAIHGKPKAEEFQVPRARKFTTSKGQIFYILCVIDFVRSGTQNGSLMHTTRQTEKTLIEYDMKKYRQNIRLHQCEWIAGDVTISGLTYISKGTKKISFVRKENGGKEQAINELVTIADEIAQRLHEAENKTIETEYGVINVTKKGVFVEGAQFGTIEEAKKWLEKSKELYWQGQTLADYTNDDIN